MTQQEPPWKRIITLFAQHGLAEPPWRLRDELTAHLCAYDELKALHIALTTDELERLTKWLAYIAHFGDENGALADDAIDGKQAPPW